MKNYLLGVATVPAIALAAFVIFILGARLAVALDRIGISIEAKFRHQREDKVDAVGDYRLTHDIWWERAAGPIFTGCWYREDHTGADRRVNRWIGIGHTNGPNLIVFRKERLDA